jgi:hypothetical protein
MQLIRKNSHRKPCADIPPDRGYIFTDLVLNQGILLFGTAIDVPKFLDQINTPANLVLILG